MFSKRNKRLHDCSICLEEKEIESSCCMKLCKDCLNVYSQTYSTNLCRTCCTKLPVSINIKDQQQIKWAVRFAKCMGPILKSHYRDSGIQMPHSFSVCVNIIKYSDEDIRDDLLDEFRRKSDTPRCDIEKIYETCTDDSSTIAIIFEKELDKALKYLQE